MYKLGERMLAQQKGAVLIGVLLLSLLMSLLALQSAHSTRLYRLVAENNHHSTLVAQYMKSECKVRTTNWLRQLSRAGIGQLSHQWSLIGSDIDGPLELKLFARSSNERYSLNLGQTYTGPTELSGQNYAERILSFKCEGADKAYKGNQLTIKSHVRISYWPG